MREEYITMRKSNRFLIDWFFKYYSKEFNKDKHNPFLSPQEFQSFFSSYFTNSRKEVLSYLDLIFKVELIENDKGEVVYIK